MNDSEDLKKSKTLSTYVFVGKKYRISIISDVLIRFEYSETGSFNDYPTLFAANRSFGTPKYSIQEDKNILIIKNDYFTLEYYKEKPFIGSKLLPDQYLKVSLNGTDKMWYFNHPEARNCLSSGYNLDDPKGADNKKGLYSLDGFVSFDDSKTPIINKEGNLLVRNENNIDTYLFIYNKDFEIALRDYFTLTSFPSLIPKYALGVWWNKNDIYGEKDIQKLVENFKKYKLPFSVLILGDYARTKNKDSNMSFTFNKQIFPNPLGLTEYLHSNHVRLGLNIMALGNLGEQESKTINEVCGKGESANKQINVYDNKLMQAFLKKFINPLYENGVDFLWIGDNAKENLNRLASLNYYLNNNPYNVSKRYFSFSRNFGIASHKCSALYSGKTLVSWKTLKLLPFFNSSSANLGLSWWSHDIGGYIGGVEDSELYMRYVQFGTFSPIFRFSSEGGKYYKREPWKWDANTFSIVRDYMQLRHKLIPYLYSEARKYSVNGMPLVQPLYYKYPETYDEPLYKNEYYFGSELFICPITDKKDNIMNRVVHRILLPKGIWYDFKTGKKFVGGKRYVTFYKDEDYPVFAKTGAIIPLNKLDENNLNDVSFPKKLEINIFPGRSNTYKLYEDDGLTSLYKNGQSLLTEINYNYKENDFSVSIEPIEGNQDATNQKRSYIIRFRNVKFTKDVQVFCDEINIPYRSYTDDTDFVVEFDDVSIYSKIFVFCKGKDIEIEASRVINDDLESIISDLKISTDLKIEIDKIIFSDLSIRAKRIAIKKLKSKGLQTVFINMFMKLLEYLAEL